MLVLERKTNETISIGDYTLLTVLEIRGKVILGFDAPRSVVIVRDDARPQKEAKNVD